MMRSHRLRFAYPLEQMEVRSYAASRGDADRVVARRRSNPQRVRRWRAYRRAGAAAGQDPGFRRALLREPRLRAVLDLAADRAGWARRYRRQRTRRFDPVRLRQYLAQVAEVSIWIMTGSHASSGWCAPWIAARS